MIVEEISESTISCLITIFIDKYISQNGNIYLSRCVNYIFLEGGGGELTAIYKQILLLTATELTI